MKAITLRQPGASLVACGAKQYETRTWEHGLPSGTLLAIHAAMKQVAQALEESDVPFGHTCDFMAALELEGVEGVNHFFHELPRGAVVAIARTGFSVQTDSVRGPTAFRGALISEIEEHFGDYSPGRWAWALEIVKRLDDPILAKGGRRLWNWQPPEWLERELQEQGA